MFSRTAKTAKTVMKATPLELNPLFRDPEYSEILGLRG